MIKTNELRIGNYVNSKRDGISVISEIRRYDNRVGITPLTFKNYVFHNTVFEPIPLTPEILEKCGFETSGSNWFYKTYFTDCQEAVEECGITINTESFRCMVYQTDEFYQSDGAYTKKNIKYLHQLQNLYFALTGEELTFKP